MGPFSFLNGASLFALAAAALPILIHLFSRRKLREVPFSHLRFLDEITKRKVRRMRLRQWLLLALRTLAVALLALALSRPVWHGGGSARHRGSSTVAILLDDSFSMEARLDPRALVPADLAAAGVQAATRFAEARQRAREVIDLLSEGDRAVLIFTAAPLRVPYESTVRDPSLLREEVQRTPTRPSRADLAGALERVYPILAAAKTLNREVFVISDFQRNQAEEILHGHGAKAQEAGGGPEGGESPQTGAGSAAEQSRVAGAGRGVLPVPEGTRVYLLPVTASGTSNVAVTGALYESDPAGPGGRLTVRLRNPGPEPLSEGSLQTLAGDGSGRVLAEGYATVEAGAAAQTVLTVSQTPADGRLVVRSAPDLLERDDARYIVTRATSRFRVLIVTGGALTDPQVRDEARFAVLALDPWRGARLLEGGAAPSPWDSTAGGPGSGEEAALFDVATVSETDLGLNGSIDADAVLLLNVGRLSASAVDLLERFQKDGGGILIALGDRVDPRMYNTQILPRLAGLRLEDVEGEPGSEAYFSLRSGVVGHPIFEGFPVAPGGALTRARFQRLVRVRLGPASRVLAEFRSDRPALVEEPGMLLFAASLDRRWSDFPTSASFLPFLHRSLLYLILGGRAGRQDLLVGDPLVWPLSRDAGREVPRALGPNGIELPLEIAQTERGPVLRSGPVPEPGFYTLVTEGGLAVAPGLLRGAAEEAGEPTRAVNVDTRESDLAPMTDDQVERLFGGDAVRLTPGEDIARHVQETRYGRELWKHCLALAFLLLVAESLLARGRGIS